MIKRIKNGLDYLIKHGKRDFVIYPYGKWGRVTKQILNEDYGIQEKYIVDHNSDGSIIRSIDTLRDDYDKNDFIILVSVDPANFNISLDVHRVLMGFAKLDRIADLLAWSPFFTPYAHFERICSAQLEKISPIECCAREIYYNGIAGSIAEAGVYKGETAKYMNMLFPERKLYLFDTFSGFDEKDQKSDDNRSLYNLKYDFSKTTPEIVLDKMHFVDNCIVKKGWFPQSTDDIDNTERYAFVRLDMDLYDPIYAGLEYFYPRMNKGGYILVHDCRSKNFDGSRKALIDFCRKNNIGYMCMQDRLGTAVINIGW